MLSKASMVKCACQLETMQVHMLRSNSPHGTNLEPGFIARGSYTIVNFIVAKKTYCRLCCDFCSAVFIGRLYNDNRSHDIPKTLRFFINTDSLLYRSRLHKIAVCTSHNHTRDLQKLSECLLLLNFSGGFWCHLLDFMQLHLTRTFGTKIA